MKDPKLFLVSAPSGAGKSSLIDAVLTSAKQSDLALELSISYTTRSPRKGESNGNQYFFISEADFINKKNANFFLEHAEVHGNWYGTSVDFVESKLSSGINLILEIDVQGFRQINELDIQYESIFILPPSIHSLEERIKSRGDEDLEAINLRLKNAHGKKMDFILQELFREVNTLSVKIEKPDLKDLALTMKLKVEELREQAQNLE